MVDPSGIIIVIFEKSCFFGEGVVGIAPVFYSEKTRFQLTCNVGGDVKLARFISFLQTDFFKFKRTSSNKPWAKRKMDDQDDEDDEDGEVKIKRESQLRSVLKTLSWRVVATTTTLLIAWALTGSIEIASMVAFVEFFAKIPVYYIHERVWQRAPRGTIRKLFHTN